MQCRWPLPWRRRMAQAFGEQLGTKFLGVEDGENFGIPWKLYGFYSDLIGDFSGISWNFMEASGLLEWCDRDLRGFYSTGSPYPNTIPDKNIQTYVRSNVRVKCPIKRQNLCHVFQDLLEAKYTFVFVMFPLYVMFVKRATEKGVICSDSMELSTAIINPFVVKLLSYCNYQHMVVQGTVTWATEKWVRNLVKCRTSERTGHIKLVVFSCLEIGCSIYCRMVYREHPKKWL